MNEADTLGDPFRELVQGLSSWSSPKTRNLNAKDAGDKMLFECKQEMSDDCEQSHVSRMHTFDPAVKPRESSVKENANPDAAFRVKKSSPKIVTSVFHSTEDTVQCSRLLT